MWFGVGEAVLPPGAPFGRFVADSAENRCWLEEKPSRCQWGDICPQGPSGQEVFRGRVFPVVGRPFLSVCRREVRGTDGGWDTPFSLPVGLWGKRMFF